MFCSKRSQSARQQTGVYATRDDFRRIFTEDMAGLHLLAYLLTTNEEKAEQCFVAGLDDTIKSNPVFKQWARSWSKRAIIKNAIKAVAPLPGEPRVAAPVTVDPQVGDPETDALITAVAQLPAFQRFVFVMSVLEGYAVTECSTLLACTASQVVEARSQALTAVSVARTPAAAAAMNPVVSWKSLFTSAEVA